MKKKFLSAIAAFTMLIAVFVPIVAEPSPHRDNQATIDKQEITVDESTITIESDGSTTVGPVIEFKNSSMTDEAAANTAKGQNSNYSYVTVFKLDANEPAASLISNYPISFKVKISGAKKGEKYYIYRLNEENGSVVETLDCSVDEDGVVTIKGIKCCTTFIVAKDTTSSGSGSSSSSGGKVVTCEDANGKGWVWSEAKGTCVYSVTNTATK